MNSVAILTPDPDDLTYAGHWQSVLAGIADSLAHEGVEVTATPWTAHLDSADALRAFPLVMPLLAWGYHFNHSRWLRACQTWRDADIALANPAKVLAWNSDKRYLLRLAEQGISIPATVCRDRLVQVDLDAFFNATGVDEAIIKPTVSGGAWHTRRVRRGDALGDVPDMPMMIQPYLRTIESQGETSLLFFDGRLSHVVNKRPVAGEFRIQSEFGGNYSALETPPADALTLAEQTLSAIGSPLLYARIDLVPDGDGRWLLMEAELIEPDMYFAVDPLRGRQFARAVRSRLDSR